MAGDDYDDMSLLRGLLDRTPQTGRITNPRGSRRSPRSKSAPNLVTYIINHSNSRPYPHEVLPSTRKLAVTFLIYLGVGTICFYLVRHQITGLKTNEFLDSVYFCIVTMTTVGYGDLVPSSAAAKLLSSAFVFSGMAFLCVLISKAAEQLVKKQERLLIEATHKHHQAGQSSHGVERHKCFLVVVILVLLIVAGTIFLTAVEKLDAIDAFYCVCCTITTLGYGDKSFSTMAGRVFAVFWVLASTICLAVLFLCVAEVNFESRQRAFANWTLTRDITNEDIEAADIDDEWVVGGIWLRELIIILAYFSQSCNTSKNY